MIGRRIRDAVREAIPSEGGAHFHFLDRASVMMISADRTTEKELDANFDLMALERPNDDVQVIYLSNFLINFIENIASIRKPIKDEIYEALGKPENGGKGVTSTDLEFLNTIQKVFLERRTIRDILDLVWTLRLDEELPEKIKESKQRIMDTEKWIFDFAYERAQRVFYLLHEKIEREREKLLG